MSNPKRLHVKELLWLVARGLSPDDAASGATAGDLPTALINLERDHQRSEKQSAGEQSVWEAVAADPTIFIASEQRRQDEHCAEKDVMNRKADRKAIAKHRERLEKRRIAAEQERKEHEDKVREEYRQRRKKARVVIA